MSGHAINNDIQGLPNEGEPFLLSNNRNKMNSELSHLAATLVGSEIVKLGNEISARIRNGEHIYNYTIGDFDPALFPIPAELERQIIKAYQEKATNYPSAEGILPLREAVSSFLKTHAQVDYSPSEIQVASGGRPLIYSIFRTLVDPGDKVIYAVPSWNNNHYTNMNMGTACEIEVTAEQNFMPTAEQIAPLLPNATLLCLCTPQNPTGTILERDEMEKICRLVLAENQRRGPAEKKLFLLFDQMYFTLTYGDSQHFHPVALVPEMRDYTISLDGISKAFAATGLRVGWAFGPGYVMAKIKALLSHIGAWAPMAEQRATAAFLQDDAAVNESLRHIKKGLEERLWQLYKGFELLKSKGYPVDAIKPQAAIYLTVKLDLKGKSFQGRPLHDQSSVTQYLLDQAQLAIVPFHCFGSQKESPWYRISVGTCKLEDLGDVFALLEKALSQLS